MVTLSFKSGTIEVRGLTQDDDTLGGAAQWDGRSRCFRAPAVAYAEIVRALVAAKIEYDDQARRYDELPVHSHLRREPRPFQREALQAWTAAKGRGVVVLPTGSGKSHVALMAIEAKRRSALAVAPTLDLVRQWYDLLRTTFASEVGVVGGGEHRVLPLTVATYDSAYLHMEHLGNRFGLVIFDECHHLPSESYAFAARACLAPYRLGLTATPDRTDQRDALFAELVGPVVYRKDIVDLSGEYLSDYETVRVAVELEPSEREEYAAERAIYTAFLRKQGIRMGTPRGWGEFIMRSSRGEEGQRAMKAYRRQRELALAARAKLDYLEYLLVQHRRDRTLIFTQDNATAHAISRRFLLPSITHQTKVTERSEILERFSQGRYTAVVTSKVLNEGVDVPSANVAVVVSGSGSVREHVQRLGRILRRQEGKMATLYEIVSSDTNETFTSERRRDHEAYRISG